MNPMNKNEVFIKVDPEEMAGLMPETVKKSIARRAASASNRERRRRIVTFCLLVASVVITLAVGVFADTKNGYHEQADNIQAQVQTSEAESARWNISEDELRLVEMATMSSARGESQLAMQAVCQCIRTTCEKQGLSVAEAIAASRFPTKYTGEVSSDCEAAVRAVAEGTKAVNEDILYCYNPAVQDGSWHESQTYVCTIGSLRFFK